MAVSPKDKGGSSISCFPQIFTTSQKDKVMDDMGLAMAIFIGNLVVALGVLAWCNHKIKELTDKDNWK
jgi:hypothetical protein